MPKNKKSVPAKMDPEMFGDKISALVAKAYDGKGYSGVLTLDEIEEVFCEILAGFRSTEEPPIPEKVDDKILKALEGSAQDLLRRIQELRH